MTKNKAKQRLWSENWRWKWGKSSDFRRRVTGAKPWELVHHKDHNKADNNKSNFELIKPKDWMTAIGIHNELHPEKAIKGWKIHARKIKNWEI